MLPLYRDEAYIVCDMALAKCYALVHSIADQNGASTVWADESNTGQASQLKQARQIIKNNRLI